MIDVRRSSLSWDDDDAKTAVPPCVAVVPLTKLESAVDNLNSTLKKVNSRDGTLGLLMNDPKLYQNLNSTTNSLNVLLQDIRLHPKRYINVSVFGKKDKNEPLMQPLSDTATKVPGK